MRHITLLIGLANKLCDIMASVETSNSNNPAQIVFHCVFSFGIRFCSGFSTYISSIVLTKDCYSFYSSSQSITYFFLIGFLSLNTCFSVTFALSDGHIHIHHMD